MKTLVVSRPSPILHLIIPYKLSACQTLAEHFTGDRDERDGPGLAATRIAMPRDKAGRSSRDQKQPRIDSDHDDDYE
jgi:hypothetical protein